MSLNFTWPQRPLIALEPAPEAAEAYKTRRLAIGHCAAHDQYVYDCDACLHEALGGRARRKAVSEAVADAAPEAEAVPKRRRTNPTKGRA